MAQTVTPADAQKIAAILDILTALNWTLAPERIAEMMTLGPAELALLQTLAGSLLRLRVQTATMDAALRDRLNALGKT